MLAIRVWLHQRQGDEWGWSAWSLEHLGFATWAPTREEVLERVPAKLVEYGEWLARHGERWDATPQGPLEVVEEIAGNEVVFRDDLLLRPSRESSGASGCWATPAPICYKPY